jgi:hypothetical protein
MSSMYGSRKRGDGAAIKETAIDANHRCLRRLGTLLAWLDQEHRFSADAQEEDLAFFVDPVHLDAYAESLDAENWRTVVRSEGSSFYLALARKMVLALQAEASPDHVERVRALVASWNG